MRESRHGLPPCDHDECPPTGCVKAVNGFSPSPVPGSRCGFCYWALYDGDWCQNPDCKMHGKSVGENRVHLKNEEAQRLISTNDKENPLTAPPCSLCDGKGYYSYDHTHIKRCEQCCKHDVGWWELTEDYSGYLAGADNGCCRAGCGQLRRELQQSPDRESCF
jgi:hypothetical protein